MFCSICSDLFDFFKGGSWLCDGFSIVWFLILRSFLWIGGSWDVFVDFVWCGVVLYWLFVAFDFWFELSDIVLFEIWFWGFFGSGLWICILSSFSVALSMDSCGKRGEEVRYTLFNLALFILGSSGVWTSYSFVVWVSSLSICSSVV